MKNLKEFPLWEKCFQKVPFWVILHRKNDIFLIFLCFFEKHDFALGIWRLQCLGKKIWNVSKFWKKRPKRFKIQKNQRSENTYWNTLLRETTFSEFSELLRKAKLEVRKFTMVRFCKKLIQLVRLLMKRLETCHNLRKSAWEKCRYESCYSEKMSFFLYFPCFSKSMILKVFKASEF